MSAPLFLIGFMATGKSTAGRLAAARLGRRFVDLDEEIEARTGRRIADIFRAEGESAFRHHEARVLAEIAPAADLVVACGGGTPCFHDNLALMKRAGLVAALTASLDEVVARALGEGGSDTRPLLAGGRAAAERLYRERAAIYAGAHFSVATGGRPPEAVADEIAERARLRLGDVRVAVAGGVPVHAAPLASLGALHHELIGATRVALVTDDNVFAFGHAASAERALTADGVAVTTVTVPAGEASKTLAQVERVAAACVAAGLDRRSAILAVGGGVVGDLAGFVAAVLYRGIACAQVPTTLLAMIDSSIGGKAGVDLPAGKNLVGAFWQPSFVLADVATLETLPARERRAAHGEVVKYALLGDEPLWRLLEAAEPLDDTDLVLRCARQKAEVVASDERELTGARARLNLGHTVGHAIESASGFQLLHGECVGLGLIAAARLSTRLGVAPRELALEARVTQVLARLGLPVDLDAWLTGDVLAYLGADKKRKGGKLGFIAIEDLGRTRLVDIDAVEIGRVLRESPPK